MDDVGNGRIETGISMADRVPGYPGPEPDGYPVPKILESPSTTTDTLKCLQLQRTKDVTYSNVFAAD